MNSKVEQPAPVSPSDLLKYGLALLLAVAGLFAFYWFEWPGAVRALAVAAGLLAAVVVFATTAKGHQTREFLSESRFELRKVVWPTREEAMRTTWVVMIAVVVISLLLAGFDVIIQAAVKFLLGR